MEPTPGNETGTASSEAYDRLRKLQAVTDAALAHLELDDLLEELLVRVRDIFEADTCAILLLDGDELVARAAKGIEEEVEQGVRIPLGRGFAGRIAATREPVVIGELENFEVVNPILRQKGIRSMFGAPLIVHGDVLGVIHVGSLTPREFTREDVLLLEQAAERVARGLEKALIHERLVRLDHLKRSFVAIASHELRTPAATVSGAATTLYHRFDELPEAQIRQLVTMLHEQSQRLVRLTEQLLDLSRLDSESAALRPERFRVLPELRELVATIAPDAQAEVDVRADGELELVADRQAFDRIVSNLLVNAFRHGSPPVRVAAAAVDRHFRLTVEDAGGGVRSDFVPRLFERFERDPDSPAKGSGLGLAIARSYAQAHGGDLVYDAGPDGGARFELVLPRHEVT